MNRSDIRRNLREKRRSISPSQRQLSAVALLNNLQTQDWYLNANSVAVYLSSDGEIDLTEVIQDLAAREKTLSLPKLGSDKGAMQFCDWQPDRPLISNRYGILEPHTGTICAVAALSLILTPLVAFDSAGNRIGMGGGYYDRLLFEMNDLEARPIIVGVAYDFQQIDQIDAEEWDIPLDAVVTDKEVIAISARLTQR